MFWVLLKFDSSGDPHRKKTGVLVRNFEKTLTCTKSLLCKHGLNIFSYLRGTSSKKHINWHFHYCKSPLKRWLLQRPSTHKVNYQIYISRNNFFHLGTLNDTYESYTLRASKTAFWTLESYDGYSSDFSSEISYCSSPSTRVLYLTKKTKHKYFTTWSHYM